MLKERRLITVKEAASYLNISPSSIYRMLKNGQITAIKIGSDWFFEYSKLDQWIDAQPAGKVTPEFNPRRKSPKH